MEYTVNEPFAEEQEIHLRDIINTLLFRKMYFILGFIFVCVSASVYLLLTEPQYEAKAVMEYRQANPTTALLDNINLDVFQSDLEIDAQKAFLMSPRVLNEARTKLLKDYGIILTDKQIENSINLSSPRGSNILELSVKACTPSTAALIANTIASIYTEKNTERKSTDLDNALVFLQNQLSQLDAKLNQAYENLAKFKEKEGIIATPTPEGMVTQGLLQKLGEMQEQLVQTEMEIGLAQASLDSVRSLINQKKQQLDPTVQEMTVAGGLTPQINIIRQQIVDLELELSNLQQQYTDKHKDVINLKQKLESARASLKEELAKLGQAKGETLDPLAEWQSLISQEIGFEVKLRELKEKEKLLNAKIDAFKAEHPNLVEKDVQLMQLEKERVMSEETYKILKAKLEEIQLMKQMRTADVEIINEATEPRLPVKPKIQLTIMLALVLGVMVGLGLALLREYMDNTVRSKEEVERLTGLSVIGVIPKLDKTMMIEPDGKASKSLPPSPKSGPGDSSRQVKTRRTKHALRIAELTKRRLTNVDRHSPVIESYRAIRSSIKYASTDGNLRSLLITSSIPGEGKSLTISNLAITFARTGTKTILVDCDMHRPRIHYMFGVDREPGVSELLTSQIEGDTVEERLAQIIKPCDIENLYVIPSGKLPPNPGDLLASEDATNFLDSLKEMFDIVLVDAPPLGPVSDITVLAKKVDSTILVVKAGSTKRPLLAQSKERLDALGVRVIGAVINELDIRNRRYSDYYYYYSKYGKGYYFDEEDKS